MRLPSTPPDASEQRFGSPKFCPVRARVFQREDKAGHLGHSDGCTIFTSILPRVLSIHSSIAYLLPAV